MHVGVCMRISADSLEDAKEIAQHILYKYSHDDEAMNITIEMSPSELIKSLKNSKEGLSELDEDGILLWLEATEKDQLYNDLMEDDFLERYYYELDFNELENNKTPLGTQIIEILQKNFIEDQLEEVYLWADDSERIVRVEGKKIKLDFQAQLSTGYWDYDYGVSDNFGLHNDENGTYRIWTCPGDELNTKFLKKVFSDDDTDISNVCSVVEFWVDEDENCYSGSEGSIVAIREMFSNIKEDTYFVVASVHI